MTPEHPESLSLPRGSGVLGRRLRRYGLNAASLVPFGALVGYFLFWPIVKVVELAFQDQKGHFTTANMTAIVHTPFLQAFSTSLKISLYATIIPAIIGLIVAYVLSGVKNRAVTRLVSAAQAVLANFGGVNLVFIFIAAYGTTGYLTQWLADLGWDPWNHGFDLFTFTGIVFIYCYFQVPLMVIIITPALGALRPQWREACAILGGGWLTYWRRIGVPVLMPSILGALTLLFGSAFSAYATAETLTSGSIPIVPIFIGNFLNGNVVAGEVNVGFALGVGMMIILVVLGFLYAWAYRRSARWLQS